MSGLSDPLRVLEFFYTRLSLKIIIITLSEMQRSFRISSTKYFDFPYGFVQPCPVGCSSVIGRNCGVPYTVADDENTNFFTLFDDITSKSVLEPVMLF